MDRTKDPKPWLACIVLDHIQGHEFDEANARAVVAWLRETLTKTPGYDVKIQLREGQDLDSVYPVNAR